MLKRANVINNKGGTRKGEECGNDIQQLDGDELVKPADRPHKVVLSATKSPVFLARKDVSRPAEGSKK